ncbi:ribonuclease H-like [Tachysurus ichikawai]
MKSAIICKDKGRTVFRKVTEHKTGSSQTAEAAALLQALNFCTDRVYTIIMMDSGYVVDAYNQHLDTWKLNGFVTAKRKEIAHNEMWIQIAELGKEVQPTVVHQSSHSKQKTYAAEGNREVDMLSSVNVVKSREDA